MSAIQLNGSTFSGSPTDTSHYCAPLKVEPLLRKTGKLLTSANGTRNRMYRTPAYKRGWKITWEDAPNATRAAVEALYLLTGTFTYVDEHGSSHTVQSDEDEFSTPTATIAGDGTIYYAFELTIWEP